MRVALQEGRNVSWLSVWFAGGRLIDSVEFTTVVTFFWLSGCSCGGGGLTETGSFRGLGLLE